MAFLRRDVAAGGAIGERGVHISPVARVTTDCSAICASGVTRDVGVACDCGVTCDCSLTCERTVTCDCSVTCCGSCPAPVLHQRLHAVQVTIVTGAKQRPHALARRILRAVGPSLQHGKHASRSHVTLQSNVTMQSQVTLDSHGKSQVKLQSPAA